MSIKNPQQDLYETIQHVHEEVDQVDEKYTEDQRRKREHSRRNPGDVAGKHNTGRGTEDGYSGHDGSQVGTGGRRKHGGYAAVRSTKRSTKNKFGIGNRLGGVTGSASMTGADNQEKKVKGEKEEPDVTGIRQSRLKQRLKDKRKTESFDDDNAIIEEIKNRVLAVLDERNKE